ncbi:PREDICTED: protein TRIGALACTOSYLDIACYLGLYCEROL 5, chloroplastic [Nicotiana attenuata]|uniref:protein TRIGALACTOSYLDIACYLGLYCEROL 5, chloroplastic n=1 Tax=Nicotiana attenuata TaxID=49451 RepID=UPI0009055017|nr:PREDICTED: protein TRIGALACTOSYLDIACYLGLYCEROL 5, chloroplastic [Nicotiana attenuata]
MNGRDDEKGLVWKLPIVKTKQLGKIGPAFGLGIGCGFGLGIGLIGGTGFGPGLPGLQLGFGFGAGCGIGLGFGYAVGRGIAYDDHRKYSNVGKLFNGHANFPNQDEVGELIDELVVNTKKLIKATTQELDKWRRS